jgi:hypothetical protein
MSRFRFDGRAAVLAAGVLFVVLATANSGGYRFGAGDQAFYEPAAFLQLHPDSFPRDRELMASQARLTIVDEVLATSSRLSGLDLPALFAVLYVVTLIVMAAGAAALSRALTLSPLACAGVLALLTLRHRIAKTGANTLEGYFHPRQLAFGLGMLAMAAALRRRWAWSLAIGVVAAAVHPTTAVWWAAAIAGLIVLRSTESRRVVLGGALLVLVLTPFLAGAIPWSSLPALRVMDADWVATLAEKDYLFPSTWPAYAWITNVLYLPIIAALSWRKHDTRLIAPSVALFAVFALTLPLVEGRVALAVQLQITRVFWLLDLFATILLAWFLVDSLPAVRRQWSAAAVALLALIAVGRGGYTMAVTAGGRPLVSVHLPADDWTDAMHWIETGAPSWLVIADPEHAWRDGTSVRVAAHHDVLVETVKDSAIGMYDRGVAMRTAERRAALAEFERLDATRARALADRYGRGVLITGAGHAIDLPRLYANASYQIFDLR